MEIKKLSDDWLFQRHSKETIKKWLRQLRYFYLKRAWGGHANDGDEFQVAFLFTDREDLQEKMKQLGVTLHTIGDADTAGDSIPLKHEIKQYTDLEQPGHCTIFGQNVFLWVYNNSIHITISGSRDGNRYEVTEDDLKVCIALEKHFDTLGWEKIIDTSLEKNICCISQKNYPELYVQDDMS